MKSYISYGNYGFSTRNGGCSTGSYESNNLGLHTNDKYENVIDNRKKLAFELGFNLSDFVFSIQEHTNNYYKVTTKDLGRGSVDHSTGINSTDALYTFESNIVLATYHADCTPIYFYSKIHNLIGVIHAGWLGTSREITFKTLEHIINDYNIAPSDLTVHIGPSISRDVYEVKQDLVEHFPNYNECFSYKNDKIYFDNVMANMIQIKKLGITNILHDNRCTFLNEDLFFSHRRELNAGRMIAYIYQ